MRARLTFSQRNVHWAFSARFRRSATRPFGRWLLTIIIVVLGILCPLHPEVIFFPLQTRTKSCSRKDMNCTEAPFQGDPSTLPLCPAPPQEDGPPPPPGGRLPSDGPPPRPRKPYYHRTGAFSGTEIALQNERIQHKIRSKGCHCTETYSWTGSV